MDIFARSKIVFCLPHLFLWKLGGESGQDGLFSKFPRFLFCLPIELSPYQLKSWLDGCYIGAWVWPISGLLCNPLVFHEAVPPMTTRTFGGFTLGPAVCTSDCPYESINGSELYPIQLIQGRSLTRVENSLPILLFTPSFDQLHCSTEHILNSLVIGWQQLRCSNS